MVCVSTYTGKLVWTSPEWSGPDQNLGSMSGHAVQIFWSGQPCTSVWTGSGPNLDQTWNRAITVWTNFGNHPIVSLILHVDPIYFNHSSASGKTCIVFFLCNNVRPVLSQNYFKIFLYYFEVLFFGGSRNSTSKGPLWQKQIICLSTIFGWGPHTV